MGRDLSKICDLTLGQTNVKFFSAITWNNFIRFIRHTETHFRRLVHTIRNGSLVFIGTHEDNGSLSYCGTLYKSGLLKFYGTLAKRDSITLYDTFLYAGSLPYTEAILVNSLNS